MAPTEAPSTTRAARAEESRRGESGWTGSSAHRERGPSVRSARSARFGLPRGIGRRPWGRFVDPAPDVRVPDAGARLLNDSGAAIRRNLLPGNIDEDNCGGRSEPHLESGSRFACQVPLAFFQIFSLLFFVEFLRFDS